MLSSAASSGNEHATGEGSGTDSSAEALRGRAEALLRKQADNEQRIREQRREARGGDPTVPEHRHVSKSEQYERDTSADSILAALRFDCGCGQSFCVTPSEDIVRACLKRKLETKNFGLELTKMLRDVVVEVEGVLVLDYKLPVHLGSGVHACPLRFKSLFCIKEKMWRSQKKAVQRTVMSSTLWGVPASMRTVGECGLQIRSWFRLYAQMVGCYPPNADNSVKLQIDPRTMKSIWGLYVFERPLFAVTYPHFCKVAKHERTARHPHISFVPKKDVSSPCATCLEINERLQAALEARDAGAIRAAQEAQAVHTALVREERRIYMDTQARASYRPPLLISCVWDIMDQKKTNLPNWKGPLKLAMAGSQRMPIKVLGFTFHGEPGWISFAAPPWVEKGGNLTCSAVYLALLDLKSRHATLPRTLRCNIDGGPENWCLTVFAFFAHVVSESIFEDIMLSRMLVGHTHNDQDGKFSRISVGLHGADKLDTGRASHTPEEWEETLRNSFVTDALKPAVKWTSSLWDFDSFYAPHVAVLKGYGAGARLTREEGSAEVCMEDRARSHLRCVCSKLLLCVAHSCLRPQSRTDQEG